MRNKKILLLLLPFLLSGCDDGRIYPTDIDLSGDSGITVVMTGEISGSSDSYESGYSLVLAAFNESDDYAIVSKTVHDGSDSVELSNVSPKASTIELCLINSLRKRILTLSTVSVSASAGDRISFDVGKVDASHFSIMNNTIFGKSCVQCHGATGNAAAGLDLRTEEAYRMLVGTASSLEDGVLRVNPGDAASSTLWRVVATDVSESWKFDHSNLLTYDQVGFIENWINNLSND